MKRWLLVLTPLLGCGNELPPVEPACGAACHGEMSQIFWVEPSAIPVELVLVADPAVLEAPGARERLRDLIGALENRGLDLHVAVVPARAGAEGGRLLPGGCGVDASFLEAPATCGRPANFGGGLDEVAACLLRPGPEAHQPLEALRTALSVPARGFLREKTALWLIFLAGGDDDSREAGEPVPVAHYIEHFAALRSGAGPTGASVIARLPAPRLAELANGVGESVLVDLSAHWIDALDLLRWRRFSFTRPCLPERLVDTDPAAPGIQPECVASDVVGSGEHAQETAMPRCGSGVLPCYEALPDPACPASLTLEVHRGGCLPPPETTVKVSCAVER